jgi:hypothetical protein
VLAFVLLSAGGAVLAAAVRGSGEPAPTGLSTILFAYSFGVLLAGLTCPGSVAHWFGALTAFAAVPVSATSFPTGWFLASFASWPILYFGLGERATVFVALLWLFWLYPGPGAL